MSGASVPQIMKPNTGQGEGGDELRPIDREGVRSEGRTIGEGADQGLVSLPHTPRRNSSWACRIRSAFNSSTRINSPIVRLNFTGLLSVTGPVPECVTPTNPRARPRHIPLG